VTIRFGVVAVAAALLLSACGGTGGAGGGSAGSAGGPARPPAGQGGLHITTQLGEQCPHIPVTPDPRCDPKPRPDTGFVVRTADGAVVTRGRTGSDGQTTVFVRPGSYVVRGDDIPDWRIAPERRVTVSGTETVPVPLTYTNGIQ
jgi:hypothetical protein